MQVYVTKRRGDLKMTLSYTWSKALADASRDGAAKPRSPTPGRAPRRAGG